MKRFRRILFWGHLAAGISAGVVILVMAVTGVVLAFEHPLLAYAEREMMSVASPQPAQTRLPVDTLLQKALAGRPDAKPTNITLQSKPSAAAMLTLGREGVIYLNPYTGKVLGNGAPRVRSFFRFVQDWHRWLGAAESNRATARAITGAANVLFLVLAFSGVYLWFPRDWNWRKLVSAAQFRRGLKRRSKYFNCHTVTGFWSSLLLIVITATGMVMSYQWANNLLYRLAGSEPPAAQRPAGSAAQGTGGQSSKTNPASIDKSAPTIEQLWARAEQQAPGWQTISLRLPLAPNSPVVFNIREGKSWLEAASSQLTLKPGSTEILKWEPFDQATAGRRARTWVRFLHTGEAGGSTGQALAGLASLGGCFLVLTGFTLAWKRFRSWRARPQEFKQPEANLDTIIFEPGPK